ncbi:unnamed protein product [Pseudo-nitzschia multistriata]|uniref:Uncharacterized protein n=1 Tax=Pseudo-nitzschia multistriata TaxID=183589 RepID=A0A448ZKB0_9STRA|nr:unnamed protein product [Pseudo-nitzschia multistriata]
MTIRVEREALLSVISTSPSLKPNATTTSDASKPCNPCIQDDNEYVIVDSVPTKSFLIRKSGDDDAASVCTLSTSSVSSCDSSTDISSIDRRVSFASQLVTDVWTRERTLPEDVSNLYYSSLETQTFRQEYRLEKKLISELSIDPETFPVDDEDLSNLVAATTCANSSGRHRISRVCVVYNDKLETFCNPTDFEMNGATQKLATLSNSQNSNCTENGDIPSDFFDNDSFWSGSLTWY